MEILAQSSLLVALTSFAFGFSTLARNVRNKLYIRFAIACAFLSAWALFFFLSTLWPHKGLYGWHLSLNAWVTPALLIFIQYMMRIEKWKSSRLLLGVSLVLCVTLSIALILGLQRHAWIKSLIYYTPTLLLIQTLILIFQDSKIEPVVGLGRRKLLYWGVLLSLFTCVMDHIPGLWIGIPIFGNLALTAFLYLVSQALLQQKLLNFFGLFSRFLVLVLIAFLLATVYSLVAVWAGNDFGLFFLNSFIASFLLMSLLNPIRTLVRYATEGFFSKKRKLLQEKIQQTQAALSESMEPLEALASFEVFLESTLSPRGVAFYLQSKGPMSFKRVKVTGAETWVNQTPTQISPAHPVLEAVSQSSPMQQEAFVLVEFLQSQYDRMAGKEHREQMRLWIEGLRSWGANLAIPLSASDEIFGLILLDVPNPPEEWGSNWSILHSLEPLIKRLSQTVKKTETYANRREMERMATIGEMAAGLAHEIRNPLGAITGAAQYLKPHDNKPDSRFLRVIVEEVDRLNRVVNQFLDYSKPGMKNLQQVVELNHIAQQVVTLLSTTAPRGVDLSFETSLLEAKIRGPKEQLHQVLLNLIQNSFKSLGSSFQVVKEVRVSVQTSEDGTRIVLTVEDNGPGISNENMAKIFTPFFSTYTDGSGLGLSISQKIVQACGGWIEVESIPHQRTAFRVMVPRCVANASV